MACQNLDDPIKYHQEAVYHYESEIDEMQSGKLKHFHAEPDGWMYDDTARILKCAQLSKKMHEGLLTLSKSYGLPLNLKEAA